MSTHFTHDVVISGAGMVGLALAAGAAKANLKVCLIEKSTQMHADSNSLVFSPRVSAINHASERLLKNLGAWSHLPADRLSMYTDMSVWDGLGQGQIHFAAHDVSQSHLGHIIENRLITDALRSTVQTMEQVELIEGDVISQWHQDGEHVSIESEQGLLFTSKTLVASEGKHSPVRLASNIDTWSWDYGHTAIVTTVRHEKSHRQTASQVFLETGPLAFLPLTHEEDKEHFSSIVWSVKNEEVDALMALDDQAFKLRMNQAFEATYGELIDVDPRFAFPLTAQQAKQYFDGRVVALGDAAHTIHPLAGLGVNLGFLDAATLAGEWERAELASMDLGHEFVMRRFQRQRQTHNLAVAALMEGLKRLFDTQLPAPVIARNLGLQLFNNNRLLKRPLIQGALGDLGTPLPPLCR